MKMQCVDSGQSTTRGTTHPWPYRVSQEGSYRVLIPSRTYDMSEIIHLWNNSFLWHFFFYYWLPSLGCGPYMSIYMVYFVTGSASVHCWWEICHPRCSPGFLVPSLMILQGCSARFDSTVAMQVEINSQWHNPFSTVVTLGNFESKRKAFFLSWLHCHCPKRITLYQLAQTLLLNRKAIPESCAAAAFFFLLWKFEHFRISFNKFFGIHY